MPSVPPTLQLPTFQPNIPPNLPTPQNIHSLIQKQYNTNTNVIVVALSLLIHHSFFPTPFFSYFALVTSSNPFQSPPGLCRRANPVCTHQQRLITDGRRHLSHNDCSEHSSYAPPYLIFFGTDKIPRFLFIFSLFYPFFLFVHATLSISLLPMFSIELLLGQNIKSSKSDRTIKTLNDFSITFLENSHDRFNTSLLQASFHELSFN